MSQKSTITENHITTDDISFSAFLKMMSYPLIKINQNAGKSTFTFELKNENAGALKMQFINSDFIKYYNELRNLKKLV